MNYGIRIQLPSRGRYGVPFVNIRRPKMEDLVDYLQSYVDSITAKNNYVSAICDTDLTDYPVGDRDYVFINTRSLVNSSTITGSVACDTKGCKDIVPYILELTRCKVSQLPDDFQKDYELVFPICKEKKVVNVLTVGQERLLEDYIKLYGTADIALAHSDLGDNLYEFARYACMLKDSVSVASVDKNITFLRNLDWSDFELLLIYDVMFDCGPEVVADAVCDTCKQKYRVRVRTDASFFGLSLEGLVNRHRFLAKVANIGFQDFLNYTAPLLDTVTEGEVTRVKKANELKRRRK